LLGKFVSNPPRLVQAGGISPSEPIMSQDLQLNLQLLKGEQGKSKTDVNE